VSLLSVAVASAAAPLSAGAAVGPAGPASSFAIKGDLVAVAAASADSAWAVGYAGSALHPVPLIAAWNGRKWRRQNSPAPNGSILSGVAAVSARDAWVVGQTARGKTLILHWNGKKWSRTTSPSPGRFAGLSGIAAVSARSAWAVGSAESGSRSQTLILRWNGKAWKRVPSPNPAGAFLAGVAAKSVRSAWTAGVAGNPAISHTLTLRWNGKAWKQVRSPSPRLEPSVFRGVAVTRARTAWAVGCTTCATASGFNKPLIERWNGSAWKKAPIAGLGSQGGILSGVAATSAANAWAVGGTETGVGINGTFRTLIAHWNGRRWRRVKSPSPGKDAALIGVAAVSARDAWAVGNTGSAPFTTLILRWNGTNWR
jgi:hypothetical protein